MNTTQTIPSHLTSTYSHVARASREGRGMWQYHSSRQVDLDELEAMGVVVFADTSGLRYTRDRVFGYVTTSCELRK